MIDEAEAMPMRLMDLHNALVNLNRMVQIRVSNEDFEVEGEQEQDEGEEASERENVYYQVTMFNRVYGTSFVVLQQRNEEFAIGVTV